MVNLGNLSFHVVPRQQGQKSLHLEQRVEHLQMIELLLGGWRVAYFQKANRLNRGDSGDVTQQAKFVPRLHWSALASYTTSQDKVFRHSPSPIVFRASASSCNTVSFD